MKFPRALLVAAVAILAIGCDPYNPNLGDQPFRCGTSEPRCPSGYVCVEESEEDQFCRPTGGAEFDGGAGDGDAAPRECDPEPMFEPNEDIDSATQIPIPDEGDEYMLSDLEICPEADTDVFGFRIDTTGKNARIEVTYDPSEGEIELDMLNSAGVSIREGISPNDPMKLRADFENLAEGEYYGEVKLRNMTPQRPRYSIRFLVTADSLPE